MKHPSSHNQRATENPQPPPVSLDKFKKRTLISSWLWTCVHAANSKPRPRDKRPGEDGQGGKSDVQNIAFGSVLALAVATSAFAADTPGVTATEIKVGGVFAFSGPASAYGLTGRAILAYVQSIK